MRRALWTLVFVAFACQLGAQSGPPNFTGTWTLADGVAGRGNSIVSGRELTIAQAGATLTLRRPDASLTLVIDGRDHEISLPAVGRGASRVTLTYRCAWDGSNLVIATLESVTNARTGERSPLVKRETVWLVQELFLVVRRETLGAWPPTGSATFSERSTYRRTAAS